MRGMTVRNSSVSSTLTTTGARMMSMAARGAVMSMAISPSLAMSLMVSMRDFIFSARCG